MKYWDKIEEVIYFLLDGIQYHLGLSTRKKLSYTKSKILYLGEYFPVRIRRIVDLIGETPQLEKVLFISKWGFEPKLIGNNFDRIVIFRNKYQLKTLLRLEKNIQLIHAFEPKAYFQSMANQGVDAPFLYDTQDILINYFYQNPPKKWQRVNLKYEKIILQNADGFISQSLELNEAFRLHNVKNKRSKRLFFPIYCDEKNFKEIDFNKSLQNVSLVYIGGINPINSHSSSNFLPFIESIQNNDVRLTIFPSPFSERECYQEYKQLEKKFPKFTMQKSVPFKDLDLTTYHFGIIPFNNEFSERYFSKHKYASTMKFFVYLEMGIPILMTNFWEFPAWLVKRYKLGLVISYDELNRIDELIKTVNYHELLQNIKEFRDRFSIGTKREKIVAFYNLFLKDVI